VPRKRKEPFGYQPNNPLTIYYKKYIEKEEQPKKIVKKRKLNNNK
jgi:hypothetical protein